MTLPNGETQTAENLQLTKFTDGMSGWGEAMNTNLDTIDAAVSTLQSQVVPAQVNSDWSAESGVAEILNKPALAAVATSGRYSDLTGTPVIGAPSGLATLDSTGKVPVGELPSLVMGSVYTVNSQASMLALNANQGDVRACGYL